MKMRALLGLLLAGAVLALWLSASVWAKEKTASVATRNVVIDKRGIVIPGTEMAKADQEAMNKILSKYDKSLYRIDTYENGKRKRTQGTLTDVVTDKRLASEIAANVKRTGFTQYAVQIREGATNNPLHAQNPAATTNPLHAQNPAATTNPLHAQNPGATTNPLHAQNPSPGSTNHPQSSANSAKPKSDELVERLKPILEKYQKK